MKKLKGEWLQVNEVNETLREINTTISYFKRKKRACEEAIEQLESEKLEIMKKYNIGDFE